MHIITHFSASVESKSWQLILRDAYKKPQALLAQLGLSLADLPYVDVDNAFPMLVPEPFLQQMRYGDSTDPLLRQVLPILDERSIAPNFSADPLGERNANVQTAIIHKYHGRVLLMLASGCAVNCRYCFRRHFPYGDNRLGKQHWQKALAYVQDNPEISEVILSGGDPLLLSDARLSEFVYALESLPQLKRLRIHSRLPVVIPQRLTPALQRLLTDTRLATSLVIHCNHKQELSELLQQRLYVFKQAGMTLLNQSVLLKGVNDNAEMLIALSEQLFSAGVLPYYLHLLDKVQGAAHFYITDEVAFTLYANMQARLPGYLLPKLVREEVGKNQKTVLV